MASRPLHGFFLSWYGCYFPMTLNCDLHIRNNCKRVGTEVYLSYYQSHVGYIADAVRRALYLHGNRDSVACITTCYGLGCPGFRLW